MNTTAFRTLIVLILSCLCAVSASAQTKKAAASPTDQAVLLGQFGDWGAYRASPGGKKICFALSKPTSAKTEPTGRNRDAAYAFVSTRPSEKVKNEISVIVGYPQKPGYDATATIGSATYAMYTQNDGAWVKNAAEEAQMVDTMRRGADLVVKSESGRGTKTMDTYSLKGMAQALDRVAEECKLPAHRVLARPRRSGKTRESSLDTIAIAGKAGCEACCHDPDLAKR